MNIYCMNLSKERPGCRRKIEKYLRENPDVSLDDMAQRYYRVKSDRRSLTDRCYLTDGMRTQVKRMLQEREHPGIIIKGKSFFLETGSYEYKYQISFSKVDTVSKILHLIDHLSRKNWVTPQMIHSLIKVTATKQQRREIRRALK